MKKVNKDDIKNRQILEICAVEMFKKIERKKLIEKAKKTNQKQT